MTPISLSADGSAPSDAALSELLFGVESGLLLAFALALLGCLMAAALLAYYTHRLLLTRRGLRRAEAVVTMSGDAGIEIQGRDAFRRLVPHADVLPQSRAELAELFGSQSRMIGGAIDALVETGERFDLLASLPGGAVLQVLGRPAGLVAEVVLRTCSRDVAEVHAARAETAAALRALKIAEQRLAQLPVAAAELQPDGTPVWTNTAFDQLLAGSAASGALKTALAEASDRPFEIDMDGRSAPGWYRIHRESGAPSAMIIATDAAAEVAADLALSRFMNKLADTFAHLSVGLAVFDAKQSLTMFNPALCVLLGLDTLGLAGRPSLRAFLEALRQQRKVPEVRDYPKWREKIIQLASPDGPDAYHEDWTLTSGQVLRVTGRHHGEGSVVFLFEDISTIVRLERRYRQEIEISQTTLDNLIDAVAVFDTTGSLVFANTAFETMWGIDTALLMESLDIGVLSGIMSEKSSCDAVWERLCLFVKAGVDRKPWTADVTLASDTRCEGRFSTLPDGSVMTLFRELPVVASEPTSDTTLTMTEHAISYLEDMRGRRAEAPQIDEVTVANRTDLALAGMIATLSIPGLERARDEEGTTLNRIAAFLDSSGLKLRLMTWELDDGLLGDAPILRQVLWGMVITVTGTASPGSTLDFSASVDEGGVHMAIATTSHASLVTDHATGAGKSLLEELVRDVGGELHIESGQVLGRFNFRCSLPSESIWAAPETKSIANLQ